MQEQVDSQDSKVVLKVVIWEQVVSKIMLKVVIWNRWFTRIPRRCSK